MHTVCTCLEQLVVEGALSEISSRQLLESASILACIDLVGAVVLQGADTGRDMMEILSSGVNRAWLEDWAYDSLFNSLLNSILKVQKN